MTKSANRFCSRGFTLVETMLAIALFSVATLILFNCLNDFRKIYTKQDTKSGANSKMIKIYKSIEEEISNTGLAYFDYYKEEGVKKGENRWFLFPSGKNGDALITDDRGFPSKFKIVMYYLYKDVKCCDNKGYEYCPHKMLIKHEFVMYSFVPANYIATVNDIIEDIDVYLKSPDVKPHQYPKPKSNFAELSSSKVVVRDIVDMELEYKRDYVFFTLKVLREPEAKKQIPVGKVRLIDYNNDEFVSPAEPFLEIIGWNTAGKNF